jgi:hypothetical protein
MAEIQNPNKLLVAYLKCTFIEGLRDSTKEKVVYKKLINSDKLKMDYAILNMKHKTGLQRIESITPEQYEEATGESISQI